jgi:undecaprenyl-diphosphatase
MSVNISPATARATAALKRGDSSMKRLGFITAFIVAIPIERNLIGFVGRHGLRPFAWYRIVLGVAWAVWLLY